MTEKKKTSENEKLSLDAPDESLFPALYEGEEGESQQKHSKKTLNPNKDTFTKGLKGLVDPKQFLEADSSPQSSLQDASPLSLQPSPSRLRLGYHSDGPVPTQGELNAIPAPFTDIAPEPLSGSWERWSGGAAQERASYSFSSSPSVPSALEQDSANTTNSGAYQTYANVVREQSRALWEQKGGDAASYSSVHQQPFSPEQDPHANYTAQISTQAPTYTPQIPTQVPYEELPMLDVGYANRVSDGGNASSAMWPSTDEPMLPDDGTFSAAFWAIVEDVPVAPDEELPSPSSRVEASSYYSSEHLGKRSPSGGFELIGQEDAPPEDLRKSAPVRQQRSAQQAFSAKEHEVQLLRSAQPTDEMPAFTLWAEQEEIMPQRTSPSSTMWPSLSESSANHPNSPSAAFWSVNDPVEPAHSQKTTLPSMKAAPDFGDFAAAPKLEEEEPIFALSERELANSAIASSSGEDFGEDAGDDTQSGRDFFDLTDATPDVHDVALYDVGMQQGAEMHDPVFAPPSFLPSFEANQPYAPQSASASSQSSRSFEGYTFDETEVARPTSQTTPKAQHKRRQNMDEYATGSDESLSTELGRKRRSTPSYADLDVMRKLQAMWMLPPELQVYEREHGVALGDTGIHPAIRSHESLDVNGSSLEAIEEEATSVPLEKQMLPKMPPSEQRHTVFPVWKKMSEGETIQRRVRSRYESIQVMSEDAMWQIELVRDFDLKRNVAMKRLKPDMHFPHAVLRMAEEVQIMAALAHPNIPEIHDVGVDEKGQYYFVMEHLKGETMRSIIKKLASGDVRYQKRFPLQTRLFIFRELVRAIEYAHRKGVLHRNLNPSHVVVGARDEVKLLGWELAHKFQAMGQDPEPLGAEAMDAIFSPLSPIPGFVHSEVFRTRDGRIQGSPAYMAPEQIQNLAPLIDERSDVYGLATIFYEWIGLRYYLGAKKTLDDLSEGIVHEEPIPLHLLNSNVQPRIPSVVSSFALHGLQKDPNKRFASTAEMRSSLEHLLAGGGGGQGGSLSRTLRFFEERPLWFVSFLIFFAFTLLLSGVHITGWLQSLWK